VPSESDSLVLAGDWSSHREKAVIQGRAHARASGAFSTFFKNIGKQILGNWIENWSHKLCSAL